MHRIIHCYIEEVGSARAIRGAKSWDDHLGLRMGIEVSGPRALQVGFLGEPDAHGPGMPAEIVNVPAHGAVTTQMTAHAGLQPTRSPGAADIKIGPRRELVLPQRPNGTGGGMGQPQDQAIRARCRGQART